VARFLFLSSTVEVPGPVARPPLPHTIGVLDQYQLDTLSDDDLLAFDGMILSMHADQRHLGAAARRLDAFVERRGLLVNGHVMHSFLPELAGGFMPLPERTLETLTVTIGPGHDVFRGVNGVDLTFRRGVAGFWARGTQTPPRGATILTTLGPKHAPCDWTVARSGGGRLFIHPGNDVWTFHEPGTATADLWPKLLDWLGGAGHG
jgi:hypothetical protein